MPTPPAFMLSCSASSGLLPDSILTCSGHVPSSGCLVLLPGSILTFSEHVLLCLRQWPQSWGGHWVPELVMGTMHGHWVSELVMGTMHTIVIQADAGGLAVVDAGLTHGHIAHHPYW